MRALFIVGVRLIGVLALYWALKHIPTLLAIVRIQLTGVPESAPWYNPVWELALVGVSFAVSLGFSLVLLFANDRVLSRVPLRDAPLSDGTADPAVIMRGAVVAAGLVVAVEALPRLLLELYALASEPSGQAGAVGGLTTAYGPIRVGESALQLGLACVLLFRSDWIVTALRPGAADRKKE